jgi:hypothetical protein
MAKKYEIGWTFGGPERRQYQDETSTTSLIKANKKYDELRQRPEVGTIGIREWSGGSGTLIRDNFVERHQELVRMQEARRKAQATRIVPEVDW